MRVEDSEHVSVLRGDFEADNNLRRSRNDDDAAFGGVGIRPQVPDEVLSINHENGVVRVKPTSRDS